MLEVGANATGEQEASRSRIVVYGAFDCTENLWNCLPFIEQHGLFSPAKRSIWVSRECRCLGWLVEAYLAGSELTSRGGLSHRPRTVDHHSGKRAELVGKHLVGKSRLGARGFCLAHVDILFRSEQVDTTLDHQWIPIRTSS